MAKRTRGSSRPGQRRPIQRATTRPAGAPLAPASASTPSIASRPAGLTAEEEARAAELEARIVAEERAATEGRRRSVVRPRVETEPRDVGRRSPSGLAVRAAEEYAYVGRDVRRIGLLGGSLITLMIALWVVTHALGSGAI